MSSSAWKVDLGDDLNEREERVLFALADGLTVPEIADELTLGAAAVKEAVQTLRAKLGAKNQAHAVALAYHRGILRALATA